jgi:3-hydroxyacyl-[acyl-carrier-protein] dehydratase
MTTLYNISNLTSAGNSFRAEITFDPAHPLFSGHFPGRPIVPGVVLVEITAALVSQVTGKDLLVKEASLIKFLHVIEPSAHPLVIATGSMLEQADGLFKVDLAFNAGDMVFAKLRGIRLALE